MSNDVFAARQYAEDLQKAVAEKTFYYYMDFIFESQAWVSYVDAINGKTREFADMEDFLTHRDGLDINDLGLFLGCLQVAAASGNRVADLATDLLLKLQDCGLEVDPVPLLQRMIDRLPPEDQARLTMASTAPLVEGDRHG